MGLVFFMHLLREVYHRDSGYMRLSNNSQDKMPTDILTFNRKQWNLAEQLGLIAPQGSTALCTQFGMKIQPSQMKRTSFN